MKYRPLPWHDEALRLSNEGVQHEMIAVRLGQHPSAVFIALKRLRDLKVRTKVDLSAVPLWVVRVGLADDFLDILDDKDEFAAASHCRALLREMRASA